MLTFHIPRHTVSTNKEYVFGKRVINTPLSI